MINPGLLTDMTADEYHADPCPEPSLSSSIARIMIDQSPRHAWHAHPRLGLRVDDADAPSRAMMIGTAAHKLILGRGREIARIEAGDFKGGAARAARDEAIAAGKSPILIGDYGDAVEIAGSFAEQISRIEDCQGFGKADSEVVGIAHDLSGVWLRGMFDKFEDRGSTAIIWDVKTTGQSASPYGIGRKIADMGYDVQAALYERIVATLRPELIGRIAFRFAFIENTAPHLLTVAELDSAGLEIGRRKVAAAIAMWGRALETNNWPGYPAKIIRAEYPVFHETRWIDRETGDMAGNYTGADPFLNLAAWQPPRREDKTKLKEFAI